MLMGDICDDAYGKAHSGDPVLRQSMGGHFQHHMGVSIVYRFAKILLHPKCAWCCNMKASIVGFPSNHSMNRRYHRYFYPCRFKDFKNKCGSRGFSIRAGDAYHRELVTGEPKPKNG